MNTLPMPKNATLEMLSECCDILRDYRGEECPSFPEANPFVDRLMAIGVTCNEAVEILARIAMNYEEQV